MQILHRSVDPATETGLTNFLNSGGTAQQVALALLNSPEYVTDNGNTTSGFVTGLYRDVLHRSPDTGEQYWIQAINNGSSMAAVAAAILASAESDEDVIDGFFHRFLNRAGDSAGISYYVSLLQQAHPGRSIEASIIGSAEYFARALRRERNTSQGQSWVANTRSTHPFQGVRHPVPFHIDRTEI